MEFEFDPAKSVANKDKHGIDFEEAQALWADEKRVMVPARDEQEPRFMVIGMIGQRCWSAVCVMRGDILRIISVRRAREQETETYGRG
ncbi:MAG: BrnT family toxin [Rhizobiaceae bacterium]|nr:BrnT family toxin [Rhizobiaceae bacterium]